MGWTADLVRLTVTLESGRELAITEMVDAHGLQTDDVWTAAVLIAETANEWVRIKLAGYRREGLQ